MTQQTNYPTASTTSAADTPIAKLHLDVVGGIAGDMFIAACCDAFPHLKEKVKNSVDPIVRISNCDIGFEESVSSSIRGYRFHVKEPQSRPEKRTYVALCELVSSLALEQSITDIALHLLKIIGVAEARIHNHSLETVHFHELSDWDSLIDVVAAATILNEFQWVQWSISKLPLGAGLVKTQHGLMPIPAPATAEILKDFEFFDDGIEGERITPTGAAILRYIKDKMAIAENRPSRLAHTGYGLGTKTFRGLPNILRVLSFDAPEQSDNTIINDTVAVIEFEIDDMTGEEIGCAVDKLRDYSGVLDVLFYRANGKKSRDFTCFRVLANTDNFNDVVNQCFLQTSTIGLRHRTVSRSFLKRELSADNHYGAYKTVTRPDASQTVKAEHDAIENEPSLHERRQKKQLIESLKL